MGGNESLLGPMALFGGVGLATGVLVTAGVTLFVFRDMSTSEMSAATPTARPAGITLLREFGGQTGTPTPQFNVPPTSGTRPPLGSALAALAEQEATQRPAEAQAPASEPAPLVARSEPARPAPAPQLAPYSAPPATYFDPPPPPRPTETARPVPTDAPRPTSTLEEPRPALETGPVSPPRLPSPTVARATPPISAQANVVRPTPPIIPATPGAPSSAPSGSAGGLPITAIVTSRTTR